MWLSKDLNSYAIAKPSDAAPMCKDVRLVTFGTSTIRTNASQHGTSHRDSPNDESYTRACIKCKVTVQSAHALEKDSISSAI